MSTLTTDRERDLAIETLVDAATGKTRHRYPERCPDAEDPDSRDPRCAVCAAITAATSDAPPSASTEPTAPLALVRAQAEDDGLWFDAQTAPEAYLQQELRRLHAAVEASAAAPGLEGEAVERVRAFLALAPTHDFPSALHATWEPGPNGLYSDLAALLAAVDRLTAERDAARDLAFRAAFAPEEGAEVQWGTEFNAGAGPAAYGNEVQTRAWVARHPGSMALRRDIGPWKPAPAATREDGADG